MNSESITLHKLNAYNLQVNIDMINHLQMNHALNSRIYSLMAHIVNAHIIWLERIQNIKNSISPFDEQPIDKLEVLNRKNYTITNEILNNNMLDEIVLYTNMKGQKFKNTIHDILIHTLNHSNYHRAQINQLLVQEGKNALVTDYIVYNREEIL